MAIPPELAQLTLDCAGFKLCISCERSQDPNWVDLEPVIQLSNGESTIVRGQRAFVSVAELVRFAAYIDECIGETPRSCSHPFVPLELGFELAIDDFAFDPDRPGDSQGTLSTWILHGIREDVGRTYAGARGMACARELSRFSLQLRDLAAAVAD